VRGWPASPEGMLLWLDLRQTDLEAAEIGVRPMVITTQPDQLNTAFMTRTKFDDLEDEDVIHETAEDKLSYFRVHEDTPQEVVLHMLHIGTQSGRDNYVRPVPCEWKGKECTQAHLLRDCPMFMKKKPRERMQHIQMSGRCFNCMRKNHMSKDCKSPIRCTAKGCTAQHNVCLHDAWQENKMRSHC
jgi:hypothetical protein